MDKKESGEVAVMEAMKEKDVNVKNDLELQSYMPSSGNRTHAVA